VGSSNGAVFLSYASEDSAAADRIAEALRAGGIEVWFDRSELRGGDVWDQTIRRQIKACTLFIPLISAHARDRREGYFRLEWKLATDRSQLMSATKAFIVPVVLDDTRADDDEIPELIRALHWTRLPGGATSAAFVERIATLLANSGDGPRAPSRHSELEAAEPPRSPGAARRGRPLLAAAVVAVVVAALGAGLLGRRLSAPTAPRAAHEASIAVLPLANESGDADQQYFSDGISEDLTTALAQFPGLKVIGRASAFQFRDPNRDSRAIGAKLGVAHLLEGSVRRSGDVVRVSTELVNVADGSTEWSERYDRPYRDLFALQDEITRAVVTALRTRLLPGEHATAQSDRPPSGNIDAYNALLHARFFYVRHTAEDYRKAIEWYGKATQLDPRYAVAWSELSRAWAGLGIEFLGGKAATEAYANAREAADRALALAPDLAAAHRARAYLHQLVDNDWRGAEAEFRRALELQPNDPAAMHDLGALLASLGELQPAIDLTTRALAAEPLRAIWYTWLAMYKASLRRLDDAEHDVHKAMELQPTAAGNHQLLTIIAILRGDPAAALAAAQGEVVGVWRDSALALATQIGTDRHAADAALKALTDKDADVAAFQVAQVYALRGDDAAVFAWLERALASGDAGTSLLLLDPFLARYRGDPRFLAFCRKVGLPVAAQH
jgi:TolB-like protein/Tfp pilus assembly protein PilF